MKKLQISFAALLLSASFAFAQPEARSHDKKQDHQQKEMAMQQLNLSEDQRAQIKALNEDFHTQMKALNSNDNQTVKQQRDQRDALVKAHKEKLESIFTAEQKAQMADFKANAKEQHRETSAAHLDKMKEELNLTDQQISQLKKDQSDWKNKMDAIRNNASLDPTAKKEQLKALETERKNSLDKVLTPEQRQKWQGLKKDKMHNRRKHQDAQIHAQPAA